MIRPVDTQIRFYHNQKSTIFTYNLDFSDTIGKVTEPSLYCCAPEPEQNLRSGHLHKGFAAYIARVTRMVVMVFLLLSCASCATKLHASSDEPILGKTELSFEQIAEFIQDINPNFDPDIAMHYVNIGKKYGIRAEIAIAQAILETGWFEFKHSSAVKSTHHNYCGLGVTSSTTKGCCFDSVDEGVKAHIQHLFAYATDKPLPKGETLIDPRFKYVKRACAPSLNGLTGTWAMSKQYSKRILDIFRRMQEFAKNQPSEANQ